MASPPSNRHNPEPLGLPQYGFGPDVDFSTLIRSNHFLFRVYTPKTPAARLNDPYFVAPKFDWKYNSPFEDSLWQKAFDIESPEVSVGTYADVAKHMDWTTRHSSPFISTSFSFIWSIWEALRRYHSGVKKDVEIAVIDARAVSDRAFTAVQLLQNGLPSERRPEHWRWYRFSQEAQSVLVHGSIPSSAVLASIPLLAVLEKLPSYLLRASHADAVTRSTLSTIGWDYTERKRSYRDFCQEMANRFLQLSPAVRVQDTSAGSVRLAISFLRPWFHGYIVEDFNGAVDTLCKLAYAIAQWPGQWWAREHPEVRDLIRAIVIPVAEEILECHRGKKSVAAALTRIIAESERNENSTSIDGLLEEPTPLEPLVTVILPIPPLAIPITLPPMDGLVSPSPLVLVPPSAVSRSHSREMRTPITPPDSPTRSRIRTPPSGRPSSPTPSFSPPSPTPIPAKLELDTPTLIPSPAAEQPPSPPESIISLPHADEALPSPSSEPAPLPIETYSPPGSPTIIIIEPSSSAEQWLLDDDVTLIEKEEIPLASPKEPSLDGETPRRKHKAPRRSSAMVETAGCLVTGFLVGAFITLCILAPQRRALLHLT